ncbi:hypothetical protein FHS83_002788 [Rhizomicrobium palustre]|uniref:Uncharacterized protein n=1 Tax=Rhizomicrobium palustre TaxID=189966 RepID=A0A846N311_9PROT|nr:DUF2975 domain-containing protein [Rhizomicrobium palustre]NIK89470.1 hypothetical protein [Rhizomicrobium palustre]
MELVWLPRALRRLFRGLAILCGVLFVVVLLFAWIDPVMPGRGLSLVINMMGDPRDLPFQHREFAWQFAKRGLVTFQIQNASLFLSALMHAAIPVFLIDLLYFCGLFEVLSRLFRNVERGQCFTLQSVHFMQGIGISLLVMFLVDAATGGCCFYFLLDFLTHNAEPLSSTYAVHLPGREVQLPYFFVEKPLNLYLPSVFSWETLFCGFLVLAFSEVFRQGLKLKKDSDLTI